MWAETDLIVWKEVGTVEKVCETRENHAFHRLPYTRSQRNGAKVWERGGLTRFGNEGDGGRDPFLRQRARVPVFIHLGEKEFFV